MQATLHRERSVDSVAEYIRFLHISKGSAAELRTQVYISHRIKLMPAESCNKLLKELIEISSMLHGLIKRKEKEKERIKG